MSDPSIGGALLTDLYQLTMLDAYRRREMNGPAVFELFFRRLPARRGYMVAAGLEQVLDYLEGLRFTDDELAWLAQCGHFKRDFVDWLADLRFTGDVHAMPEGTVCFANEPIVRVEASLPEAQFVESRIINIVHYQTLIATKAARTVGVADGRTLVDFGMRRAHGGEAALWAARASYLSGFAGTATVAAGRRYGIPIFGTMAHSFVQAHDSERSAFRDFARARPENLVLLIDTYDVPRAIDTVIELAGELAGEGIRIQAVRLDSGDLAAGCRDIRRRLDRAGLGEIGVFLSGDLDEYRIDDLTRQSLPAAGYGVGTRLDVSQDAPSLDLAYKLQAYDGKPRRKRSAGKQTWPGAKQVFRRFDADGRIVGDGLVPVDESAAGQGLLTCVMRGGRRVSASPGLEVVRAATASSLASLPGSAKRLEDAVPVAVEISDSLIAGAAALDEENAGA
jgi:nicotinate phosphoribosyltransferase